LQRGPRHSSWTLAGFLRGFRWATVRRIVDPSPALRTERKASRLRMLAAPWRLRHAGRTPVVPCPSSEVAPSTALPGPWPVLRVCTDRSPHGSRPSAMALMGFLPRGTRRIRTSPFTPHRGPSSGCGAARFGGRTALPGSANGRPWTLHPHVHGGTRDVPLARAFRSFSPRPDGCRSPGPCPLVVRRPAFPRRSRVRSRASFPDAESPEGLEIPRDGSLRLRPPRCSPPPRRQRLRSPK